MEDELRNTSGEFPIIAILGPRQSGKSTLAKMFFDSYSYISFEDPDVRERVTEDPRSFLSRFPTEIIYDEVQRVPDFISYLQTHVDAGVSPGKIVITGSHNYLLMEKISQSLAGRVGIVKLLPLCVSEIELFGRQSLLDCVFQGGYPRLYDKEIRPVSFFGEYLETYVERDVRLIKNITDFDRFSRFLRILAGRTGQVLNLSAIADDCDLSHNTIKDWIGVLETSYIVARLKPYYRNYKKQILKSQKIFFLDTGLVCFLLNIQNLAQLEQHYLRGSIIETFYISEFLKSAYNHRSPVNFYYWRTNHKKEIDLVIEANELYAVEMKGGQTLRKEYFATLEYWRELAGVPENNCALVYGGEHDDVYSKMPVIAWNRIQNYFLNTICPIER